jgi:hypothetical protein
MPWQKKTRSDQQSRMQLQQKGNCRGDAKTKATTISRKSMPQNQPTTQHSNPRHLASTDAQSEIKPSHDQPQFPHEIQRPTKIRSHKFHQKEHDTTVKKTRQEDHEAQNLADEDKRRQATQNTINQT